MLANLPVLVAQGNDDHVIPANCWTGHGPTCSPSPVRPPSQYASQAATSSQPRPSASSATGSPTGSRSSLSTGPPPPDRVPGSRGRPCPRTSCPSGPARDRWSAGRSRNSRSRRTLPQNSRSDCRRAQQHRRRGGGTVPHLSARRARPHPARGLRRRAGVPRAAGQGVRARAPVVRRVAARGAARGPGRGRLDQGLGTAPTRGPVPASPPASCSSTDPGTTRSSTPCAASSPRAMPSPPVAAEGSSPGDAGGPSGLETMTASDPRFRRSEAVPSVGLTVCWFRTSATHVSRHRRHESQVIGDRPAVADARPCRKHAWSSLPCSSSTRAPLR